VPEELELQVQLDLDEESAVVIQQSWVQDPSVLLPQVGVAEEMVMDHLLLVQQAVQVVVLELLEQLLEMQELPLLLDKEMLVEEVQPIMHRIDLVVVAAALVVRVQMLMHQVVRQVVVVEVVE
tara:strand:+ start:675 stop:1043 length:369 start_codon:yes stop_codon:yes gene_type:complete